MHEIRWDFLFFEQKNISGSFYTLIRCSIEQAWNSEGNIDQTDGMYLILEKSISCTLVTTYFKVDNSWFKISIDQGKHIVNEMDVLTHVNESNTTVWNIRHEQPNLLQEIRISFMKKVRKSEDSADVARLWKLNYQILRDMWTNKKESYFKFASHLF